MASLRLRRRGHVLEVALDRPRARNALDEALVAELTATFTALPPEVRAVVLTGTTPPLCAGACLHAMRRAAAASQRDNCAQAAALGAMLAAIDAAPVAVVGRLEGGAYGGGVGLIACCDVVVAADDAVMALGEVRLGLAPAVIAPYVVAKVGHGWARRLVVGGRPIDAALALAVGLVHRVVPAAELDAAVAAETDALALAAPGALAAAKATLRDLRPASDPAAAAERAALLARLRAGAEGQEGLRAFFARERPAWAR